MNNNTIACSGYYSGLCNELALLLQLSFSEIKRKYANFPICLMDYFEKDIKEKSIEIRFDEEELTVTCTFDEKEACDLIYLFLDKDEPVKDLVSDLKEAYEYDFIKSRWVASGYFIKVSEVSRCLNDICFLVYK